MGGPGACPPPPSPLPPAVAREEAGLPSVDRTLISSVRLRFYSKAAVHRCFLARLGTFGGRVSQTARKEGLLTFTHPHRGFRSFTQGLFSVQVLFIDLLKTMAFSSG